MDYAYMGFYELFDHLLEPKKIRDEHADATNVTSIPGRDPRKQFESRETDLQTGREGTEALRGARPSSLRNKVEWNR